jgi:shikimate kinase
MQASSFVVCLDATPDAIRTRLAAGNERPLASDWEALYEKRRAAYAEILVHVDTSDKTSEQVAEEIVALWRASQ